MLCAIRGHHVDPHPWAWFASRLGQVYRHLLEHPELCATLAEERRALIDVIDAWVGRCQTFRAVEVGPGRSVGEVIDAMAWAQVLAYRTLMSGAVGEPVVHDTWYRLGQVVDRYRLLVEEIDRRRPFQDPGRR